jgi:hypothetical protein
MVMWGVCKADIFTERNNLTASVSIEEEMSNPDTRLCASALVS